MKTTAWITPAGAGKTLLFFGGQCVVRDHPRRCGENVYLQANWLHCRGSPPQVRGKRDIQAECADGRGITPAGAGKTRVDGNWLAKHKDHPRRCGENDFLSFYVIGLSGSPPQVRGKHLDEIRKLANMRITPAGAGKTESMESGVRYSWDHPRRCGENRSTQSGKNYCLGSPPQVRGKLTDRIVAIL